MRREIVPGRPDCVFEAAKGFTEAVDDLAGDTILFAAAGRNTVTPRSIIRVG